MERPPSQETGELDSIAGPVPLGVDSESLYPDVAGGGLGVPLQAELDRIGSPLRLESDELLELSFWCDASRGNRYAQVKAAAEVRAFSVDLWVEGVRYLEGWTGELRVVAQIFDAWLADEPPSGEEMAQRLGLELSPFARTYERGEAIESRWQQLIEQGYPMEPRLHSLILAAAEEPKLRQLYPFTSMVYLCFSRWVGSPFSGDLPYAGPDDEAFLVFAAPDGSGTERVLGEGDAARAVELLVGALPDPLVVLYRQPSSDT